MLLCSLNTFMWQLFLLTVIMFIAGVGLLCNLLYAISGQIPLSSCSCP